MARILTFPASISPAPEITPPAAVPEDDYQRIQAPAAAFGAAAAQGMEQFGAGVLKAADFYDQASAEQAFTNYQHDVGTLLYGDPNDPAKPGFMGLHGEDAMKARPVVQQQIEDLLQKYSGSLSTGRAQLAFMRDSRRFQSISLEQMGRHYEQQANVWGLSVAAGSMAANERSVASSYNDPDLFGTILEKQRDAATNAATHQGHDPVAARAEADNRLAVAAVEGALAQNDYGNAQTNFDRYSTMMGPATRMRLGSALRAHTAVSLGHAAAEEAMGAPVVPGASQATSRIHPIPAPPPQYAPLIKDSASQYGVPEELLTRVLYAENGFRPTGVSSAGARGIAQFMPSTAARYGVNPDIAEQAIPAAARYLADLYKERGSWAGALTGYLGGDPHKDASYTRSGAIQLADTLDRGPGAAPGANGAPQMEIWGDSLGVGLHGQLGAPGHVHGGDTPQTILGNIKAQPEDHWQGKTVVLPSGSNGDQMPVVEDTIQYLKAHGANVIAVGYGPRFPEKNAELAEIAKRQGVPVVAAEDVGATEGVHPSQRGYAAMAAKIKPLASMAVPAGEPPHQQPDQIGIAVAAPPTPLSSAVPPTTPAPSPPPGMSDLANTETELAQWHARSIANLDSMSGRLAPDAYEHAAAEVERRFRARQGVIAAQRSAIVANQNAAVGEYVPLLYPGKPVDASLPEKIAKDDRLGPQGKENLYRLYDAQIKGQAEGDTLRYGPKFFEARDLVHAPLSDPNRIHDPTQLLAMARPQSDGTQDLTTAGADKLIAELKAKTEDSTLFAAQRKAFIAAVKPTIDKSNPLMGVVDQDGALNLYRFQWDLDRKVEEYKKAGNDPSTLFDPAKPDYAGAPGALQPYLKPLTQSVKDIANRMSGMGPMPPVPPATPAPPPMTPVPQRLPGETPAQYFSRIGVNQPGAP